MEAIEALHAVQQALTAHGLPGGSCGLIEASRTFLVVLSPGDEKLTGPVTGLLEAMGCTVSGSGCIYGKLAGKLLPPPPLPPVRIRSGDCCHAGEGAAATEVKRCAGPCGRVKPATEFIYLSKAQGRRCSYCVPCERARQKRARVARRASATLTF